MTMWIIATYITTDLQILINLDNVTTMIPDEDTTGTTIYFASESNDCCVVKETLEQLHDMVRRKI